MNYTANINTSEITKFSSIANTWWDLNGPSAPLHAINPARLQFIQHFSQLESKRVLDVGCGAGILTESLAKLGAHAVGLDASEELIAVAQQHALNNNLVIDYQTSTIEDFAHDQQQEFDIITCMELLEHVPDPARLIHDCARLLKPGGQLFLSTLNRTPKAYGLAIIGAEYLLNILPKQTHDYTKFIRPDELDAALRAAKLKLTELSGISYKPFNKSAHLSKDISINYIALAAKEI